MADKIDNGEVAELIQSVKALFIPASLFLACLVMAAGTFLVYYQESLGWVFISVSVIMMIGAFFALIRFHNKLRARGVMPEQHDEPDPNS